MGANRRQFDTAAVIFASSARPAFAALARRMYKGKGPTVHQPPSGKRSDAAELTITAEYTHQRKPEPNPSGVRRQSRRSPERHNKPYPRNSAGPDSHTTERRASHTAQTAAGDAQERIPTGMTTQKAPGVRFQRTSKGAFPFGGPGALSFGKHKRKRPRNFPPAFKKRQHPSPNESNPLYLEKLAHTFR